MVQPEEKAEEKSTSSGSYPGKPPQTNDKAFENPEPKCKANFCPNFTNGNCSYCTFHCQKFHNGKHNKKRDHAKELVQKNLRDDIP